MDNRFFISDTHFYHEGVINYDNRPFSSIIEMNEALIDNWNKTVNKGSIVYMIGDFCWRGPNTAIKILDSLNGQIHLIKGNHDKVNKEMIKRLASISDLKKVRAGEHRLLLSHRPFRTWEGRGERYFNIHGHCHGNLEEWFGALDISCNLYNYTPIHIDVVIENVLEIAKKLHDPNRVIDKVIKC